LNVTPGSYILIVIQIPPVRCAGLLLNPVLEYPMIITTTDGLQGYVVKEHYGLVYGVSVRARSELTSMLANFRAKFGGELGAYRNLARATREAAVADLELNATTLGANAVIGVRFDVAIIQLPGGEATEVVAYGTAVTLA
jgi:uncharacterized protein YbjQ (UPF0145 family)